MLLASRTTEGLGTPSASVAGALEAENFKGPVPLRNVMPLASRTLPANTICRSSVPVCASTASWICFSLTARTTLPASFCCAWTACDSGHRR